MSPKKRVIIVEARKRKKGTASLPVREETLGAAVALEVCSQVGLKPADWETGMANDFGLGRALLAALRQG